MAVLAISVLGAGVGAATGIGAGAGWLIGSFVGNALFAKGQKVEGPRLTDLTVQNASEGAPIPVAWGSMRVAGTMIWSSGLIETKTRTKKGGKGLGGKSTTTTYTYSASFAILLHDGEIAGVRRIWADGKLIYDARASASAATLYASARKLAGMAIYLGTESQAADPTIQAAEGAANTPAFRGFAYLVLTGFQLADFANRIPNITAEIVTAGSGTAPYRVNTWAPEIEARDATVDNGVVRVPSWSLDGGPPYTLTHTIDSYTLDGVRIGSESWRADEPYAEDPLANYLAVQGLPQILAAAGISSDFSAWSWYQRGVAASRMNAAQSIYDFLANSNQQPVLIAETLFAIQTSQLLTGDGEGITRRYTPTGGVPATEASLYQWVPGVHMTPGSIRPSSPKLNNAGDGNLWLAVETAGGATHDLFVYDLAMNLIESYDFPAEALGRYAGDVVVYGDLLLASHRNVPFSSSDVRLYRITRGNPGTLTHLGVVTEGTDGWEMISVGAGLALRNDGVFSLLPPLTPSAVTLATVVSGICARAGLSAGQIDVTDLAGTTVDGYVIGRRMPARSAIEQLMRAYFFDAVETGGKIKFVLRGNTSVATLTEDDIIAPDGRAALIRYTRAQEHELPQAVNVQYLDLDNDYQPGAQRFTRLITESESVLDLEFALAASSAKAAQIAEVLSVSSWVERERYQFRAIRKHIALEPTDVVTLPGNRLARLTEVEYLPDLSIRCSAVADFTAAYSPVSAGNDSSARSAVVVGFPGPTNLIDLDIPAIESAQDRPGFYVAVHGYYPGWRGAEVLISTDGGVTYTSIYAITGRSVVGYTTTELPDCIDPAGWDTGAGVTVTLLDDADELSSISDASVLAGGNLAAIRTQSGQWEIVQFANAVETSPGVYVLSRMLRGRFGTERLTGDHVAGGVFVLITADDLSFIDRPQAEIGAARILKATSFGESYAEATGQDFTLQGNSQKPIAPVGLVGTYSFTTGDYSFRWNRRARTEFWWGPSVDVPLDEDTEQYRVQIVDNADAVIREIDVTTNAATYTLAQQTTDTGGPATGITWRVAQLSAQVGEGHYSTGTIEAVAAPWKAAIQSLSPSLFIYSWVSNTNPNDESVYNNDTGTFTGTRTNNVSTAPLPIVDDASIRYVNFVSGRAVITHQPQYNAADTITVGAWIKTTGVGTDGVVICKGAALLSCDWILRKNDANDFRFQIEVTAGADYFAASSLNNLNDGNWHFLVGVTYRSDYLGDATDRIRIDLYVDGVLVDSAYTPDGFNALAQTNTRNVSVAALSGGGSVFSGDIGPIFVLKDVALSAAQIAALYSSGSVSLRG